MNCWGANIGVHGGCREGDWHLNRCDSYDWITFLPMSDGGGSCNRYYVKLNTDKMKIRGVMARKGDTPEYVNRNQGGDHKGDHNWNPNDSNNGKQGG